MDLILLVLGIAVIGFVVYVLTMIIPMPPTLKTIIYVATTIVLLLYLLSHFAGTVPNVLP